MAVKVTDEAAMSIISPTEMQERIETLEDEVRRLDRTMRTLLVTCEHLGKSVDALGKAFEVHTHDISELGDDTMLVTSTPRTS